MLNEYTMAIAVIGGAFLIFGGWKMIPRLIRGKRKQPTTQDNSGGNSDYSG